MALRPVFIKSGSGLWNVWRDRKAYAILKLAASWLEDSGEYWPGVLFFWGVGPPGGGLKGQRLEPRTENRAGNGIWGLRIDQ